MQTIIDQIAKELAVKPNQVQGAVTLLDEGATVPFIARYRKEVTGALDDEQLRTLSERLVYLRELVDRKAAILKSIEEQEKLTPELKAAIEKAETKTKLEDLYLPYKPKRRTKAQIAIEAGLEPLADALFDNPQLNPEEHAQGFLNEEHKIATPKDALDGARAILMERFSENAELLEKLRVKLREEGILKVSLIDESKEKEAEKFKDYFDYSEALKTIPSHRMLAVLRGRNEDFLKAAVVFDTQDDTTTPHPCEGIVKHHMQFTHQNRPADDWLAQVLSWTWSVKLNYQIESDIILEKRQQAEEEAIKVFADNLKDLLLAAPAGPRTTLGLDPGYRTGVKVAVVDATGKILDHGAIYPHAPQNKWDEALHTLAKICAKHSVELISIGNGTASRETDKLASELIKKHPELNMKKIVVSEAGASVYSASPFAAREFPDLDVTIRGAISIARRLQDPLAELVKIEPKAIGVGQYQHDVNQLKLAKSLDDVIEDCVNSVGVNLNTASEPLLSRVAGLTQSSAANIVAFRQSNGEFKNRQQLLEVSRLGPKAFEQAAGFLRIMNADNPLDASSVHPESYAVVQNIAQAHDKSLATIIGDGKFLRAVSADKFVTEDTGELTIKDILKELEKPGRDPRPEFKTAEFKEGVEKISDLKPGMVLQGVVSNVANFGAFVDLGVHQDGLVHISALSNTFVKDPRTVVKTGDVVTVKVLEVDVHRKRIGLTMRMDDEPNQESKRSHQKSAGGANKHSNDRAKNNRNHGGKPRKQQTKAPAGAMAAALQQAMNNK